MRITRLSRAFVLGVAGLLVTFGVGCDDKKAAGPFTGQVRMREYSGAPAAMATPMFDNKAPAPEQRNTEKYEKLTENQFVEASKEKFSTFSASVDTAHYTLLRAKLKAKDMLPAESIRVADMVNYFHYDYPNPEKGKPVGADLELAPCPWNPKHQLLRIALRARTIKDDQMPPRNLTFLIDVSGSMSGPTRLSLVQKSLELLVDTLTEKDRVSIVTYAGDTRVRLTATPGNRKEDILKVIRGLTSAGSTNGGNALKMAYEQSELGVITGGVSRVILATDGDFNVGITSREEMVKLIEEKRKTGIYLTVLGYGMGNLNDQMLEQIAHHGNGHYAYIDDISEAYRLFVEQGGALTTVAKDVKLQVEFNQERVKSYRLIGYENRLLKQEDFRNDSKDAGDMGSGHRVTALFEIEPVEGSKSDWLTLRIRYKDPQTEKAEEQVFHAKNGSEKAEGSRDFQFASAVAEFGLLLRNSEYKGNASYKAIRQRANANRGVDSTGEKKEFIELVDIAESLKNR